MKIIFIVTFTLLQAIQIISSQPYLHWSTSYNGPVANDQGNSVVVDADGNVFTTGYSDGPTGNKDCLTIKYNPSGNILWTARYDGVAKAEDEAFSIKVDPQGNVYITGKSYSTANGFDIITIKYNSSGDLLWSKTYNYASNADDIGTSLILDQFSNVYVTGISPGGCVLKYSTTGNQEWVIRNLSPFLSKLQMTINQNDAKLIVAGGFDYYNPYEVYVINTSDGKIATNYNYNSSKPLDGVPNSIAVDDLGNIYVTSTSTSITSSVPRQITTAKFNYPSPPFSSYSWYNTTTTTGSWQITDVATKVDINKNVYVLADLYDGLNHHIFNKKIYPDRFSAWDSIYLLNSKIDYVPISLALSNEANQPDKFYVNAYNSQGNISTIAFYTNNGAALWSHTYDCGNNGSDVSTNMTIDHCDNIYITGSSNCNGTFKDLKTLKLGKVASVTPVNPKICQGNSITLSVTPCTGCTYKWSNMVTTANITISPSTTSYYTVTITRPNGCTEISIVDTVSVEPLKTPSISISSSTTTICSGENVNFIVTTINGGSAPIYSWSINNVPVQNNNSPSFSSGNLKNNDVVKCSLTSNALCATPSVVTSNVITISVNPISAASVTINATKDNICEGENITFTALPTNGGAAPAYEWFINNNLVGTGNKITRSNIKNNDLVYCKMTSNALCASPVNSQSNSIILTVNQIIQPTVNITASKTSICKGESVVLSATSSGAGQNPTYDWYVNDTLRSSGSTSTYSTNLLYNGSAIYCKLKSSQACASPILVSSNVIFVNVDSKLPTITIVASDTSVIKCDLVTFYSHTTNGGNNPTFEWYINGLKVATGQTFQTSSLSNEDQIYCILNSSESCADPKSVSSNELYVHVEKRSIPIIEFLNDTIFINNYSGSNFTYQWYKDNIQLTENSSYVLCSKHGKGSYTVVVNVNGCILGSNILNVSCSGVAVTNLSDSQISIYPNPFENVLFIAFENYQSIADASIIMYNNLGVKVKEILSVNTKDNKLFKLELTNLPSGIYFIHITDGKERFVKKIQKL